MTMALFVETMGKGPHLALLHGWGLNGAVWQHLAFELAEHHTLHLVDLPGHGLSGDIAANTLDAMTDAVAAVLPEKTNVLGWSLGGQVALNLAHRHPRQIDKLILVATTPQFVAGDDWLCGMKPDVLDDFAARLTTNYAATIKNFLALQVLRQENLLDTIRLLQHAVLARAAPNIANLLHGLEILAKTNLRDTTTQITQQTLLIHGDDDALTPTPAARWLASALPNCEFELIPHAAHAPFLSHRAPFVARVKEFLPS